MANTSIYAAFERMWQHVVAAISGKADKIHNHDDVYETKENAELKYDEIESNYLPLSGGNLTNHVTFDNGKGIACKDSAGNTKYVMFLSASNILWIGYDMPADYVAKFGTPIVLGSEHYGTSLPDAGIKGRIFYKKV